MTYGQSDGSTVDGYNTDGTGYIVIPNSTPSGSNGSYMDKVLFNANGLIPITSNGSSTTYYCDELFCNNSLISYAIVGGDSTIGHCVGAFCVALIYSASGSYSGVAAALSCKPLATT